MPADPVGDLLDPVGAAAVQGVDRGEGLLVNDLAVTGALPASAPQGGVLDGRWHRVLRVADKDVSDDRLYVPAEGLRRSDPGRFAGPMLAGMASFAEAADRIQQRITGAPVAGAEVVLRERVVIVDGATFLDSCRFYFPAKADAEFADTTGFTKAGLVFVNADRISDIATVAHEAVHLFAPDTFGDTFGNDFNEGVTEYFARQVIAALAPGLLEARTKYQSQWIHACAFIDRVGEVAVRDAYFAARIDRVTAVIGEDAHTRLVKACDATETLWSTLVAENLATGPQAVTVTQFHQARQARDAINAAVSKIKQNTSVVFGDISVTNFHGAAYSAVNAVYTGRSSSALGPLVTAMRQRAALLETIAGSVTALALAEGRTEATALAQELRRLGSGPGPVTDELLQQLADRAGAAAAAQRVLPPAGQATSILDDSDEENVFSLFDSDTP